MKTRKEIEEQIDYLQRKIYYCKVNDLLYDMQKYEYELELLEEDYGCKTLTEVQDKHIQSLQQTEWDVEIEMQHESLVYPTDKMLPKLDSDGCLILKRK